MPDVSDGRSVPCKGTASASPVRLGDLARRAHASGGGLLRWVSEARLPGSTPGGSTYLARLDGSGFSRVQCKTGRLVPGDRMTFSLRSSSPEGVARNYSGEVDYFGVFLPVSGDAYLIPMGEVDGYRTEAYFRLTDADAAPGGAHYAAPYRLVARKHSGPLLFGCAG
jgi:hypothetical protein